MDTIDTIIEYQKGAIKIVEMNKPRKKNALDLNMYQRITEILRSAAENDTVSTVVLTGKGDFYSSGNDFTDKRDSVALITAIREFIRSFILFPKILVAIVNGPAIGIASTTLPFCDLVFASENSYFYTPFSKLGMTPEGCSTLTFSRIMGERKALEMLLFSQKMYPKEALEYGFINYIYKNEELHNKVWDKVNEISELSPKIISTAKRLIRESLREELLNRNDQELEVLLTFTGPGSDFKFKSRL